MYSFIQFSFGSMWASIEGYPLYWMVITGAGLFIIIESIRAFRNENTDALRSRILGAGILALLAGSLVFPIEALGMIKILNETGGAGASIVLGGFYLPLFPFAYGLLWFITGLGMWRYLKNRGDS